MACEGSKTRTAIRCLNGKYGRGLGGLFFYDFIAKTSANILAAGLAGLWPSAVCAEIKNKDVQSSSPT